MTSARPVPVPDDASKPYWDAAAEHVLTAARCSRCAAFSLPPDVVCARCGATDPAWVFEALSGGGTVRSWTVARQSFLPGFEDDLPFVLVDIELDDQPDLRLIGRLMDGPDAALQVGDRVHVTFEDLAPGVSVPAFVLS